MRKQAWSGVALLCLLCCAHLVQLNVVIASVVETNEAGDRIKHVVVLMMENRSFDNLLGWLHAEVPEVDGLTGTECNHVNATDPKSHKVCVSKLGFDEGPDDPGHSFKDTTLEVFGYHKDVDRRGKPNMLGFVQDAAEQSHSLEMPMSMFTPSGDGEHSAPVMNTFAREFAVFDRYFCSVPGPTDPNRGYAMAGTSDGDTTNFNGTQWKRNSYFNFLRLHNISWNAYYQDDPWAILYFEDVNNIPENRARVHELDTFFDELKDGKLSQFTWLQPRMLPHKGPPTWQHPDASVREGELLYKSVYDALVAQPGIWNSTAFILTYDEHGGFYDHVPPPQEGVPSPDGKKSPEGFGFDRLGIRVPFVLISPWVNKGHVEHAAVGPTATSQYEHTSIMHTCNKLFGITDSMSERASWSGTFEHLFLQRSEPRGPSELPTLPPLRSKWTRADSFRQGRKPCSDHVQTMVEFFCVNNGHNLETCNRDTFDNQWEAGEFIYREQAIYYERLNREYPLPTAAPNA